MNTAATCTSTGSAERRRQGEVNPNFPGFRRLRVKSDMCVF